MGIFSAVGGAFYQDLNGIMTQINLSTDDVDITDNQADVEFSPNDNISAVGSPANIGTYIGTYMDAGNTYIVLEVVPNFQYVLYSATLETFPGTIILSNVVAENTSAPCFAAGTLIATAQGEVAVETLCAGDKILTAAGSEAEVLWLGRKTCLKAVHGYKMEPVVIAAGALGPNTPHRDLTVTADHAIVLDGLLVNASALVNGTTIRSVPLAELPQEVTYFHIETQNHDIALANGVPAETFVDTAGRQAFDNYEDYLRIASVGRVIPEMNMPRISSARLLPAALKQRIERGADGRSDPQLMAG